MRFTSVGATEVIILDTFRWNQWRKFRKNDITILVITMNYGKASRTGTGDFLSQSASYVNLF